MFLNNGSTYPIGLDLSDLSIKLVQLNKLRGKVKIQAFGKSSLPPGLITNGEIKNQAELVKAIKKIISAPIFGKVNAEEVVACLPESKTFVKFIEVAKSTAVLADIIGSEIEKHVPEAISEIYYDWQIIDETPDKYFVLIGAAPKNIVNQYTAMLDEAGLSPVALEIEPVAICRCLLKEERPGQSRAKNSKEGKNYGLLDIGASHTSMIFYSANSLLFTVSMPISGEEITAKISQALELNREQADKAKIICGLDETKANGVIKEILSDMIKNLIFKIKESVAFYDNYFGSRGRLDQIFLTGGGSSITGLDKIIAQETSLAVNLADPFNNLSDAREKFTEFFSEKHSLEAKTLDRGDKYLTVKQNASSAFATAIGLALRGIFIDEL